MASNTSELLAELQRLENRISPTSFCVDGDSWFRTIEGSAPVLVSAPHACRHRRDGTEKMAEEYTAALAMYLAETTGCHAIYTTHQSDEDPNWHQQGSYKTCVAKIVERHSIQLLIDLHGMTNRHHMGIALGTMHERSISHCEVLSPFQKHGFVAENVEELAEPVAYTPGVPQPKGTGAEQHWQRVVVDHPRFTGGVINHTVTRYAVEQLKIAAVQVEVASVNRIVHRAAAPDWPHEYRGNPCGIAATVNALTCIIHGATHEAS